MHKTNSPDFHRHSSLIVWELNSNRDYISSVGAGLKLMGLSSEAIVGKNHTELHINDIHALKNVDRAFTGEEFSAESETLGRYHSTHYIPKKDETGKTIGLVAISVDVTEEKKVSERLKIERENLETIFDISPAFMAILLGEELVFEKINPKYRELVGDRNLVGLKFIDAFPELKNEGFHEQLLNVYRTGQPHIGKDVRIDIMRYGLNVESRFVDYIYQQLKDEDGKPIGVYAHGIDVTDSVMSRKIKEESEAELKAFIDSMPQIAFIANPEGNITFFNKSWYEFINGMKGTEGWGWKDLPIHHPDDLHRTIEKWKHSVKTGEPYEVEYRLRRFDGEYRWYLGRATAIRNQMGQIIRWVGTNTDIHNQKADQELSRMIIETIPQGIWRTNPDGSADYFSERFYELVNYSKEEFLGWGWSEVIHPDDKSRVLEIWQRCMEAKQPVSVDFRILMKDKSYRWFLSLGNPFFDECGELIKYYGTWTDIHQERMNHELLLDSEAKFKTITNALPQMVWSTRPDGHHDYYNNRWYEFIGMEEGSTDGDLWTKVLHPEDRTRSLTRWQHSLNTGEPYEIEYRLKHKSGVYRWVLGRALPIRNNQNQIIRWMGTCTDIQDQKDQQYELSLAVKSREEFLSIASHELKTPLTSLRLHSQIALRILDKEKETDKRIHDFASRVDNQVYSLNRLVEDMLDISRVQSGNLTILKKEINLITLLNETIERISPHYEQKKCPLPVFQTDQKIILGQWDEVRLDQVFTNILSNALRYGEGGHVTMSLELLNKEVIVRVKDQGAGMRQDDLKRIFLKFERGNSNSNITGLGLGLYISQKIVEAHEGEIWAESFPGDGTTFFVRLKTN